MPTLHWIGKDKIVNHHQEVPFRVLNKKYSYKDGKTTEEDSDNKIIHGDNLEALKSLLPEYEGKIKCIYIDPPYNTGNENWIYNDNVSHPKLNKWLGEVVGKESEDLTRHDKWLCMMYPRLKLLHKLLHSEGVIFISIDDNEISHLKLIMNEIFGSQNFLGDFVISSSPSGIDYGHIARTHDYAIFYAKNQSRTKTFQLPEKGKKFSYEDDIGPFNLYPLYNGNVAFNPETRPNLYYPFYLNPNKIIQEDFYEISLHKKDGWVEVYPVVSQKEGIPRVWRWGKKKSQGSLNQEIIGYKTKQGEYRIVQKTRHDSKVIRSVHVDKEVSSRRGTAEVQEIFNSKKFSFPKPVELIKRFLTVATEGEDIVLDSFAGSATTAHAVLKLNKEDKGNRKFILVEMEDYAENITAERIKKVIKGYGKGDKKVKGTGGSFNYYTLGNPIFQKNGLLNENIVEAEIKKYVWYSETRSDYHNQAERYLLGKKEETAYYFIYDKKQITTLDESFLRNVKIKAEQYIIYADNCLLDKELMNKYHIVFKKIPRDITRF